MPSEIDFFETYAQSHYPTKLVVLFLREKYKCSPVKYLKILGEELFNKWRTGYYFLECVDMDAVDGVLSILNANPKIRHDRYNEWYVFQDGQCIRRWTG